VTEQSRLQFYFPLESNDPLRARLETPLPSTLRFGDTSSHRHSVKFLALRASAGVLTSPPCCDNRSLRGDRDGRFRDAGVSELNAEAGRKDQEAEEIPFGIATWASASASLQVRSYLLHPRVQIVAWRRILSALRNHMLRRSDTTSLKGESYRYILFFKSARARSRPIARLQISIGENEWMISPPLSRGRFVSRIDFPYLR
jgi:hypothetical protein